MNLSAVNRGRVALRSVAAALQPWYVSRPSIHDANVAANTSLLSASGVRNQLVDTRRAVMAATTRL